MGEYFGYILPSRRYGTLYVGVTNNLSRRLAEHRVGTADAFTKKYKIHRLVHLERLIRQLWLLHAKNISRNGIVIGRFG